MTKTALITGACSGIGLAVTRHLLSKHWSVILADIRPEAYEGIKASLPPHHTYIQTDVSSWESQASLFSQAYTSSGERIDFFHANAGIADRESLLQPWDLDAEPTKPNLTCLDVNVVGVMYGLKLFVHYARKTRRTVSGFEGKMLITASGAGQYPYVSAAWRG